METILPGEVAWYVTGRFYAAEDKKLFDAGYFLNVQGIDAELFCGKPGEGTAHLTFLADPFTAAPYRIELIAPDTIRLCAAFELPPRGDGGSDESGCIIQQVTLP